MQEIETLFKELNKRMLTKQDLHLVDLYNIIHILVVGYFCFIPKHVGNALRIELRLASI